MGPLLKIRASTLDDLLHMAFERVLRTGRVIVPTKGKAFEVSGVLLELTNPRARISRSESRKGLFGYLGELLWYLSGNDRLAFIRYYIPDYPSDGLGIKDVRAAYGPRLRPKGRDYLAWITDMLRANEYSRRAVIPIYREIDSSSGLPEVPCTCTLQFLLRGRRLEMLTHMRSNDAFVGLPGDIFAFTMIQELVARSLGVEIGTYKHQVGSFHLYEKNIDSAGKYLDEGWQPKRPMPLMPLGDQSDNIAEVLRIEKGLRNGKNPITPASLPTYWQDIVQLLRIHQADSRHAPSSEIRRLQKGMHSDAYRPFIESKQRTAQKRDRERPGYSETLFPL
jgi:thymidylate synthase